METNSPTTPAMEALLKNVPKTAGPEVVEKQPTIPQPHVAAPSAVMSKSPTKKSYYSYLDGARYYFADGGVAIFQGGIYEFDPDNVPDDYVPPEGKEVKESWGKRFRELEYVCSIPNPVFSKVRVPLHRSDAIVLREVGHAGGSAAPAVGTGLVSSAQMTSMFNQ